MASRDEWAIAFAEQSASDWHLFKQLSAETAVALCHPLHYLQMACEKIAKAYRCRDTGRPLPDVLEGHVAVSKFIENFISTAAVKERWGSKPHQVQPLLRHCRQLANQVEKLAPAVDRRTRPENAEYPWESGGQIVTPADYSYPNLSELRDPRRLDSVQFVKVMSMAIHQFEQIRLT